jgi:hypothetical protein
VSKNKSFAQSFLRWKKCRQAVPWVTSSGWVWCLVLAAMLLIAFHSACNSPSKPNAPLQKQQTPSAALSQTKPRITRPDIGFSSRQKLIDHFQKHGREFGAISMEEYLRQAQELRDRPVGGDILETVRPDGVISRFGRTSGAFVAYNPDGVIRTFFRPNEGEAYFRRQSRRRN